MTNHSVMDRAEIRWKMLGEKLATATHNRNLSVRDAAHVIGVNYNTLLNVMKGRQCSAESFLRIAHFLHSDPRHFVIMRKHEGRTRET